VGCGGSPGRSSSLLCLLRQRSGGAPLAPGAGPPASRHPSWGAPLLGSTPPPAPLTPPAAAPACLQTCNQRAVPAQAYSAQHQAAVLAHALAAAAAASAHPGQQPQHPVVLGLPRAGVLQHGVVPALRPPAGIMLGNWLGSAAGLGGGAPILRPPPGVQPMGAGGAAQLPGAAAPGGMAISSAAIARLMHPDLQLVALAGGGLASAGSALPGFPGGGGGGGGGGVAAAVPAAAAERHRSSEELEEGEMPQPGPSRTVQPTAASRAWPGAPAPPLPRPSNGGQ